MRMTLTRNEGRHPAQSPRLAILLIFGLTVVTGLAILNPRTVFKPAKPPRAQLPPAQRPPTRQARLVETYGKLPLAFEVNQGQTDSAVKFLSRGHGYTMFLTGDSAVFSLRAGNQKAKVKNQKAKVEEPVRALLPSRVSIFKDTTDNKQSAANVFPIDNYQSSIINSKSPAPSVVRMKLVGANSKARVTGLDELPGKSNYFIGNDPSKWRTNVANYAKVKYEQVYPGIDLVYYGKESGARSQESGGSSEPRALGTQLEYDFVVAPGADPKAIRFEIAGVGSSDVEASSPRHPANGGIKPPLRIDPSGDLVIAIDAGDVRFHKPLVYQPTTDNQQPTASNPNPKSKITNPKFVEGRYTLTAENDVAFEVESYDRRLPLVIDPVLIYSTYLGGTDHDIAAGIAVDSSGNAYVTGYTGSLDFPTQDPLQGNNAGSYDAFVTKLSASGDTVVYSTYLGGIGTDQAYGIAVDSSGNAYVTGITESADFPTANPIQPAFPGGYDAFATKLNAAGSALVYSTHLGGTGYDNGRGIAVDSLGNAYITGYTNSSDFPIMNANQAAQGGGDNDAFVTKLNAGGSALLYSTYLGGTYNDVGAGIVVDASGNGYVTGYTNSADFPTKNAIQQADAGLNDAFVAKLNAEGSALVYSTYLGGTSYDLGSGIAIDSSGDAYVTGYTNSADFPTQNAFQGSNAGGQDAFVAKLNAAGGALLYSTYLGGMFGENGAEIAVDASGNAYVTGSTNSTDFPTQNPLQGSKAGGQDAFLAEFNPTGSALLQSTYLGGTGGDTGSGIAVDGSGYVYLAGSTASWDFPTLNPVQPALVNSNPDAFVAKLSLDPIPGMRLSPVHLGFGGQLVGSTDTAQTLTITNIGELPLTVTSIAAGGDFDVAAVSTPCSTGGGLDPGLSCGMSVTFTPTATGIRSGTLTVVSNAPASPYNARLSGEGTDFAVVAQSGETTSATVNAGGTATFNLQLAPTGFSGTVALACAFQGSTPQGASCSVSPSSVAVNGVDPAPFAVNVATTARSLAPPQGPALPPMPTPWARQIFPVLLAFLAASLLAAKSRRVKESAAADATLAVAAVSHRRSISPVGRRALQWAPLAATLLAVLLWAACGREIIMFPPQTGTPAGTYNLTLTATAGGVSKTSTLTLKVN